MEKIEAGLYEYNGYTIYNAATHYLAPSGWVARNYYQELWASTLKELKKLIG